jgi:hypothetical protein
MGPGIWLELYNNELYNVVTNVPGKINELPLEGVSEEVYESHDKAVGRLTVIGGLGKIKVTVNIKGYVPGMARGDDLVVCVDPGHEGKLIKSTQANASGTYEIVAECLEIDNVDEVLTFLLTASSRYITIP